MKVIKKTAIKVIGLFTILTLFYSCEKENVNDESIQNLEKSTSLESQQKVMARQGDLRGLVNGSDFKRYNYDANGDGHLDLVAIKTRNTGTRSTEIHVIDGKSNFTKFLIQTGTALHETGSNWEFAPGHTRRGGKFGMQLYAIKMSGTSTKTTEVHVLSQNYHNFSRWIHQSGSVLPETDRSYSFKIPPGPEDNRHLLRIQVFKNSSFYRNLDPGKDY